MVGASCTRPPEVAVSSTVQAHPSCLPPCRVGAGGSRAPRAASGCWAQPAESPWSGPHKQRGLRRLFLPRHHPLPHQFLQHKQLFFPKLCLCSQPHSKSCRESALHELGACSQPEYWQLGLNSPFLECREKVPHRQLYPHLVAQKLLKTCGSGGQSAVTTHRSFPTTGPTSGTMFIM